MLRTVSRIRNLPREREIAEVFAKHGMGYVLRRYALGRFLLRTRGVAHEDRLPVHWGDELREILEELGPTYIKVGQMLSVRPDILPPEVLLTLRGLRDEVKPVPFEEIRELLEEEFEARPSRSFRLLRRGGHRLGLHRPGVCRHPPRPEGGGQGAAAPRPGPGRGRPAGDRRHRQRGQGALHRPALRSHQAGRGDQGLPLRRAGLPRGGAQHQPHRRGLPGRSARGHPRGPLGPHHQPGPDHRLHRGHRALQPRPREVHLGRPSQARRAGRADLDDPGLRARRLPRRRPPQQHHRGQPREVRADRLRPDRADQRPRDAGADRLHDPPGAATARPHRPRHARPGHDLPAGVRRRHRHHHRRASCGATPA